MFVQLYHEEDDLSPLELASWMDGIVVEDDEEQASSSIVEIVVEVNNPR